MENRIQRNMRSIRASFRQKVASFRRNVEVKGLETVRESHALEVEAVKGIVLQLTKIKDEVEGDLTEHPDLKIDASPESGEPTTVKELQNKYVQNLQTNFRDWMANSLRIDAEDWMKDSIPQTDDKGYYNTTLPVLLIQMIEQNLQVAATIDLAPDVVSMSCNELKEFAQLYKKELSSYREQHVINRDAPRYFLLFMIGNINNCLKIREFAFYVLKKRLKDPVVPDEKFHSAATSFDVLAILACDFLLEEVFMDLGPHIEELLTKKWFDSKDAVDVICATIEDYCQKDFVHLKDMCYDYLVVKAEKKIAQGYYKALFARHKKLSDGRKSLQKTHQEVAEKIIKEGAQLSERFRNLVRRKQDTSPFDAMPLLAEIIMLQDKSMMSLEIMNLVAKYPDIRTGQLISLLMIRGDFGQRDARQLVVECLGKDHDVKASAKDVTIFSQLGPVAYKQPRSPRQSFYVHMRLPSISRLPSFSSNSSTVSSK